MPVQQLFPERILASAVMAGLGLGFAGTTQADAQGTNVSVNVEIGPSAGGEHSASVVAPDGLNRANGNADFGQLRAFAQAYSNQVFFLNPGDSPDSLGARAFSSFNDLFTIRDPALTGQPGLLNFRLDWRSCTRVQVHDPADTGASGAAGGSLSVEEGPANPLDVTQYNGTRHGTAVDFSVPVVFGQLNYVRVEQDATADSLVKVNNGSRVLATDAETSTWAGITSVRDSSGKPAKGWTISSASGFNYAVRAIPEVQTLPLLLSGLAVLACIRWKPRSRNGSFRSGAAIRGGAAPEQGHRVGGAFGSRFLPPA